MTAGPWSGGRALEAPAAPAPPQGSQGLSLPVEWVGTRKRLFGLALRSGVLTVLTLGFYRFWMKTRLRRWYWSSIRPGGLPLEYTGDPWEKLLGFLMAVVVMAFYIGIVNLILMFLSFSLLSNNFAAYAASLAGVVPIWFFAQYRARRYVLARTRWAGIRFGLDRGGWGYAGRALLHWAITILTLGLLWPRMTFALEKYKVDRTWFGTARLHQGGRWQMLYRPFLAVLIPAAVTAAIVVVAVIGDAPQYFALLSLTVIWLGFGALHYSVRSRRLLACEKSAGGVRLWSEARSGRVMGIYAGGYSLASVALLLPLILIGVAIGMGMSMMTFDPETIGDISGTSRVLAIVGTIVLYFAVFLSWSVLRHCFVTMPLWKHYAETLTLADAAGLKGIAQRQVDDVAEAEGFAEALDLGAAI